MALEIFKLVGSVFVDTDKANESLQKVDKNAGKVAEGFSKAGKVAAGVGAAIGAAVVGASAAVVNMANDTAQTADEIDKMSQKIGLSAEGYQEWAYVMSQNGMEVDRLQSGMKTLVNQMDKVREGNEEATQTFQALGVEVLNADGSLRSQEEVMNDTIRALADMGDTAERAKLQTELFGKAGTEMAPLLNNGSKAIDDLTQRAHDLGLVMSDSAVEAGAHYNDLQDDLERAGGAIKNSIGAAVLPILSKLAEKLVEFMPTIQGIAEKIGPLAADFIDKLLPPMAEMAEEFLPMLLDAASQLLPSLAEIADQLVPVILDLMRELMPVIVQLITDVMPILVDIIKKITPILSQIIKFLGPILELVLNLIEPLLELVMSILSPILDLITRLLSPILSLLTNVLTPIFGVITAILEPLTSLMNSILGPICELLAILLEPLVQLLDFILPPLISIVEGFLKWLSPILSTAFGWLGDFFKMIVDGIKGLTESFEGFGDFFKGLWDGIVTAFKTVVNFIIKGINTIIGGLNMIKPPQWFTDLTGVTGINIPTIPLLARGGNIEEAGNVIVGERGPEMLSLPTGARVTPLDKAGIDYDKLTEAFVTALKIVAPDFAARFIVDFDKDNLVKVFVEENESYKDATGRGLVTA